MMLLVLQVYIQFLRKLKIMLSLILHNCKNKKWNKTKENEMMRAHFHIFLL